MKSESISKKQHLILLNHYNFKKKWYFVDLAQKTSTMIDKRDAILIYQKNKRQNAQILILQGKNAQIPKNTRQKKL